MDAPPASSPTAEKIGPCVDRVLRVRYGAVRRPPLPEAGASGPCLSGVSGVALVKSYGARRLDAALPGRTFDIQRARSVSTRSCSISEERSGSRPSSNRGALGTPPVSHGQHPRPRPTTTENGNPSLLTHFHQREARCLSALPAWRKPSTSQRRTPAVEAFCPSRAHSGSSSTARQTSATRARPRHPAEVGLACARSACVEDPRPAHAPRPDRGGPRPSRRRRHWYSDRCREPADHRRHRSRQEGWIACAPSATMACRDVRSFSLPRGVPRLLESDSPFARDDGPLRGARLH